MDSSNFPFTKCEKHFFTVKYCGLLSIFSAECVSTDYINDGLTIDLEHIELPKKLLHYCLRSNKSNINQTMYRRYLHCLHLQLLMTRYYNSHHSIALLVVNGDVTALSHVNRDKSSNCDIYVTSVDVDFVVWTVLKLNSCCAICVSIWQRDCYLKLSSELFFTTFCCCDHRVSEFKWFTPPTNWQKE